MKRLFLFMLCFSVLSATAQQRGFKPVNVIIDGKTSSLYD